MDREAWQATVHGVAEPEMTEATWHARGVQCVCIVACFVLFQIRDCIACFNAGGNAREEG